MNFVLADYAPSTQRKDKFKLDMRVTKGQAKQMESNPFFSLYLNKYGKIVMPVFLLSKIFNAMVPRLAKYKLIRQADQAKLWGKSTAATLTIEKQSDGFVLQWTLNEVTKLQPFLRLLYQISDNEFLTKTDELGNQIPPLDAEVKRILDINYSAGLAGTKLRLDTDAIARFMTKDVEKLSFSCIRELVIEIDQLYGITTRITAFMTAKEAELLTRLQYLAIRNIDIFPIVLHWLASGYAKGPTTSVSLSRVSANIDPQSIRYAKTNEHNLCLNQDGQIWYIPREVNKSRDYESLYTRYCTSDNPDNKKFGLMVRGEGEAKTKLPANMPILVDWTNAKFSYSTGMGGQAILDLSRCRPLTATHVRNVFRRLPLDPQLISTWYKYAEYLGVPRSELLTKIGDSAASYSVMDMIFAASRGLPEGEFLSFYELLGDDEFKPAVDILTKIASVLEQKSEQFMNQYSVFTWVNTLGLLKSIAVYAPDWAKYSEEDKANRSASINQAITPGWQLPSVPFFNNAPGLMPHQVRVMNMMKDDPKFCLLPVAAGGGKCLCGDTFVYTDNGLMQLEQLFDSYRGKPSKVQKGFYRLNKPLSVISSEGNFEQVQYLYTCTKPISSVTLTDGTVHRGLGKHRFYTQNGWKKLRDLTPDDYILQQPNHQFVTHSYVFANRRDYIAEAYDAYSVNHQQRSYSVQDTVIPTKMNKALAFVLGALVAEGGAQHTFCNKDPDFIRKYKKAFTKVFGIEPLQSSDSKGLTYFKLPNVAIKLFLDDVLGCKTKSWTRFVPDCVLQSKKEHWVLFLRAYFEGDGEICGIDRVNTTKQHDGRIHCYSTSKKLATQVFEMLKCLGFRPTFMANTKAKVKQWVSSFDNKVHQNYIVKLPVADNKKFYNEIGFASTRKNKFLECEALNDRVSLNNQNSNMTTQGWFNQIPAEHEVSQFVELLEENLDKSQFRSPNGRATYPVYVKQAFVDNGLKQVAFKGQNRYQLNQLLTLVEVDSRVSNAVDNNERLTQLYNRIKYLYDHNWCRIVEVKHNIGEEQVYDLSLPTTHAWVANGYLSHNTICAIMDILKQYSQGKNAPYMVLCPNMLVSQYVQEVAFFTKGRLNAIPITTAVVRRNGLDRLQKIFDAAPRNTVVIVSYNAIVYNSHKIAYGTNTVTRFPIVEFLRQFQFGYALCDESHQLKSEKSIKARAVNILLSDIPMIRLASGTLAYNRINDIVGQASIMDPSLFGTQADFENTYGKFVKGKYAGLKHGMEAVINSRLKDDMVIAGAQRKEWAALLPQTETNYHMVNLSLQEQEIYQKVLDIASEHLEDTPELKKAMEELEKLKAQQKVEFSQERQDLIDEREERLTSRITPYLQKLERLIIDPLKESAMMTEIPADYVSEKVRKVIELVEHHIEGWDEMKKDEQGNPTGEFIHHPPTPGKVIIFTENLASAQSIFDAFAKVGSSVAENGLLYSTTNKHELLDKFNTDPNIKWMVGVETSINTGLNLQAASRIIRAEYPWQPGALEQGNARILRPLLKSKDGRTTVYFDWVVCDGTIDTLKVSRLMAKSAEIAKFEHPSDTRYQNIGISHDPITNQRVFTIPVIGVTMKSIRAGLRFVNPDRTEGELYDYFKAMKTLHGIEKEDYQTYRLQHPEEINADGTMKSVPVTVEQNPKDAKILRYIPYVEGTNLYNSDQLGLQRLDEYLNRVSQSLSDDDEDEGGDLSEDTTDADDAFLEHLEQLKGETVYCEYGECQIYSISATKPNCVVIPVHSVQRIRVPLSSVFLITKKVVKPQVLYKALAKEVGINTVVEPEYVRPAGAKETSKGLKKLRKQQEEEQPVIENSAELQINLKPMLINGLLGFRFIDLEGHDLGINILEQNGFRLAPEYYRAQIKNLRMLEQWLTRMTEMGLKFKAPYDYSGSWKQIAGLMRRRQARYNDDDMEYKANTAVVTKVVSKGQLQNILRWDVKPTNRTDVLRVQPMFSNGVVFAIMPSNRLYSIGNKIRRKRVPGMKWERGPEAYERYFARKDEALNCLKQLQESGLTITNLKQLMQTIQRARTAKFDDIDSIKQKVNRTRRTRKSKWDLSLDLPEDGEITIIDDRKDRRKRSSRRKSPWDIKVDLPQRNIRIKNDVPLTLRSPRRKWYS